MIQFDEHIFFNWVASITNQKTIWGWVVQFSSKKKLKVLILGFGWISWFSHWESTIANHLLNLIFWHTPARLKKWTPPMIVEKSSLLGEQHIFPWNLVLINVWVGLFWWMLWSMCEEIVGRIIRAAQPWKFPHRPQGLYRLQWYFWVQLLMEEILHHLGCIKPCK